MRNKNKISHKNILIEKAYLSESEWMDIYSRINKSDEIEYLKKTPAIKYKKTIAEEAQWLKREVLFCFRRNHNFLFLNKLQ